MLVTQASTSETGTEVTEIDPNSTEISLVCADITNDSWTKYTKENGGPFDERIFSFTVDDGGDVWVSTATIIKVSETEGRWKGEGLSRFNPDEEKWTRYTIDSDADNILETDHINKIHADDRGALWCGGIPPEEGQEAKAGLYQFDIDNNKWVNHFYKGKSGVKLGSNFISALCADGSDLWVGTSPTTEDRSDGGASVYKRTSWGDLYTTTSTDGGLVSHEITAIAVQGDEVWFGTPNGLSRYGYGEGGGYYEPPADPNKTFRFPSTKGCFTDSFSNVINSKSILNHNTMRFWWVFLIIGLIGMGIGLFSILRRYVWIKR